MTDEVIKNRYEFVVLYDVQDGNPNGDPDSGNMPRTDPETGQGLVTDVCLKRKIRNYIDSVKKDASGYRIYIKADAPLNVKEAEAFKACDVDVRKLKSNYGMYDRILREWMCKNFYDIRTFGAVLTTFKKNGLNCGHVKGPVQLCFSRSIDTISIIENTITREGVVDNGEIEGKSTSMGHKYIVPYGLYRCEGFISANQAQTVTGFTESDLELFWQAVLNMFEGDHSASRGKMSVKKLIVFKHDSVLGNAPSWKLLNSVKVRRAIDSSDPAKCYEDYIISIDREEIPSGVEVIEML